MTTQLHNDDLVAIGFVKVPTFTIGNNVTFNLGRKRSLVAACVGQGNEALWLFYKEQEDSQTIEDLICLHNRDYDGILTLDKVKTLIELIKCKRKVSYV